MLDFDIWLCYYSGALKRAAPKTRSRLIKMHKARVSELVIMTKNEGGERERRRLKNLRQDLEN